MKHGFVAIKGAAAAVAAAWVLLMPAASQAVVCSDCDCLCGTGPTCSVIGSLKQIAPGAVIDCTGRGSVDVNGTGTIKVTDGFFTLKADEMVLYQGGLIKSVEGAQNIIGGFTIELAGPLYLGGAMKANGANGGGSITIEAVGDSTVTHEGIDAIEANGTTAAGGGGEVHIASDGNITISCNVLAESDNSAGTGGQIEIEAGGNVTIDNHANIRVAGRQGEDAGTIRIDAGGTINSIRPITANGNGDEANGGEVHLTAGGAVILTDVVEARGGVNAGGGSSAGGSIQIEAGCGGVQVGANIDASGGEMGSGLDGGALMIESAGDVTVADGVSIRTDSRSNGGDGGDVRISSRGKITIGTNVVIDAKGDSSGGGEGYGASVDLSGCQVEIQSGATIDATGFDGGRVRVNAAGRPPDTGVQPLTVAETAVVRAAGQTASGGFDGDIELAPIEVKQGVCSNDENVSCTLDTDCTDGCSTYECDHANPDTGGLNSQFDVAPDYISERSLPECPTSCP